MPFPVPARRDASDNERGATLFMIGLVAAILIGVAAIAVDLSAVERRGQQLQNSTDAAALAGVAVWTETLDQSLATQAVNDIIAQNGELDSDLVVEVSFPSATEVRVDLRDPSPDVFLGVGLFQGNGVARDSTAQFNFCRDCQRIVEADPPFRNINAAGGGDGLKPIIVRDRIYAINHHGSTIGCADKSTDNICWTPRSILSSGWGTANSSHAHVHNDRIFFTGSDQYSSGRPLTDSNVLIGCWDTTTDTLCTDERYLPNEQRGVIIGEGDRFWVFTATHRVYCFMTSDLSDCSGYGGGLQAQTWGMTGVTSGSMEQTDVVMHESKIFVTWNIGGFYRLTCWNIDDSAPCNDFPMQTSSGGAGEPEGKLFLHRDTAGTPDGVCMLGLSFVECFNMNSGSPTGQGNAFQQLVDDRAATGAWGTSAGPVYHPPSNRMFVPAGYPASWTFCWDFESGYCNSREDNTDFGLAQTYGYVADGNCMVAFGHQAIFFSFPPEDLQSSECGVGGFETTVTPCFCSTGRAWPPMQAINLEGVQSFQVQVRRQSDNSIVVPNDGTEWLDITDGRIVDIEDYVPGSAGAGEDFIVTATVEVSGGDPWADGEPPSVLLGHEDFRPALVE